jgi:alkylated DNA repair dioxygenase AlkB
MGWHSDDERTLVEGATIASLSFGAERRFRFKHKKSGQTTEVLLEDGSLLEMKGETQRCWQHCLPKTTRVSDPRINLTFRQMIENV